MANEINGIRTNGHSRARRALNHAELRSTDIRGSAREIILALLAKNPLPSGSETGICVLSGI